MGCLQLPGFSFRLWKKTKTTPSTSPEPSSEASGANNGKTNRRSLPHHIGVLPFEHKKRSSREITKRDSGKSGLSDVTFVDDEENAKRASRLSSAKFKLSVDLKDKDELVEGLRYRGASVRRRDTVDTLTTPISPDTLISPDSPGIDSPLPKWKEEGVEALQEEKPQQKSEAPELPVVEEEDQPSTSKVEAAVRPEEDKCDEKSEISENETVGDEDFPKQKEVIVNDPVDEKSQLKSEAARKKAQLEEQENRDFFQFM